VRGRALMLNRCVQCHGLSIVLSKSRTPQNWVDVVRTKAALPHVVKPIPEEEQWYITTYLIAISPHLEKTTELKVGRQ
jgi:hypothetical protein